jgi:hypothetical protein
VLPPEQELQALVPLQALALALVQLQVQELQALLRLVLAPPPQAQQLELVQPQALPLRVPLLPQVRQEPQLVHHWLCFHFPFSWLHLF